MSYINRTFLIKNGNIEYYSTTMKIYFISYTINYIRGKTNVNRSSYWQFGISRGRGHKQRPKRINKKLFIEYIKNAKTLDLLKK